MIARARSALAGAALRRLAPAAAVAALAAAPLPAPGYPGGAPSYQTDVAPFCASCHSSVSEDALAGVEGDRAKKELIANKHLAVILAGGKPGYAELSEGDRAKVTIQHDVDCGCDVNNCHWAPHVTHEGV